MKVFGGFSDPDDFHDGFWRIALDEHKETCFLMSSKSVQLVDFRVHSFCSCVNTDSHKIRQQLVA